MPPKRRTARQVEEDIHRLEQKNDEELKNRNLDLAYQKLERERIHFEKFKLALETKKREYSALYK